MPRIFGNRNAQHTPADASAARAGQNAATAPGTPPRNARATGSALGSLSPRGQQSSPPSPPRRGVLGRFLRRPALAGSNSGTVPRDSGLPHDAPNLPVARAVEEWSQWAQGRVDEVHPRITYQGGADEMASSIRCAAEAINAHAADSNLTRLELTTLPAHHLPAALGRIAHLESLAVTMSECKALPESIGNLQRLRTLSLSNNQALATLPSTLTRLSQLRTLHVWGSPLTSLPADIGNLSQLERLDLAGGRYSHLPSSIVHLSNLTSLLLSGPSTSRPRPDRAGLQELPHELGRLSELTELKVSGHRALTRIPDSVGQLQKLQSLDLHDCPNLTRLPGSLGTLRMLRTLNLNDSGLTVIPDSIGELENLTTLRLDNCPHLTRLPESLAGLQSLQTLSLKSNRGLQTLPANIGNLRQLRKLDLSGCTNLTTLPPSLGGLPRECEIVVPHGLEQQLETIRPRLAARPRTSRLGAGGIPHRGAAPRHPGPVLRRHRDRRPEWNNAMAQFRREESAGSFSRWLDAVDHQTEHTGGPSEREIARLEEIVEAARTLPGFRSKLFSFAQTNVQIQRSATTGETVANATPGTFAGVAQAHELLLEHKLSDRSLPADAARRICQEAIRERCARMNVSEAVTMLVGQPQIPDGRGRLPGRKPWPPFARYVETHDRPAIHAISTLTDLINRLGLASEEGDLTDNDVLEGARHAQHANATVLHERYVEVARELLGENGASSSRT